MASKRHLSEVSRPSGDVIGWSPVHPLQGFPGFTSPGTFRPRAFSAPRRFAPPPTRLPYSMQAPPMGFREPDLHHPSGLAPEDGGAWPSPSSMAALPKLNCNVRRSALESGPKPHLRLEPDATPRKRGTRTGRYAGSRGVRPTRTILEEATGEQRRRSVRSSGDTVSNAAPKRALDSVRPAAPTTEAAATADRRSPPVTDPPCQSVRKPPAPRSTPTEIGLRVQGTLPGKHRVESALPTQDQRLDFPANGSIEAARLSEGDDRSHHHPSTSFPG